MLGIRSFILGSALWWSCGTVDAVLPGEYVDSLEMFEVELASSSAFNSDIGRAVQVQRAFDRHVSDWVARMAELDTDADRRLFRAVHEAYFYTLSDTVLGEAEAVFAHLRVTDSADARHAGQMLDMLVAGRQFAKAAALAEEFGLQIPMKVDEGSDDEGSDKESPHPKVIRFTSDGKAIVEDWRQNGRGLVVIVHPGCRYSQAAIEQIRKDSALFDWISARGVLLVPQDLTADLRKFARWSLANGELPIRVAYRRDGFPFLEYWATPNFYIMKDGVVVSRIEGWLPGTTTAALKAELRSIGVEFEDFHENGQSQD